MRLMVTWGWKMNTNAMSSCSNYLQDRQDKLKVCTEGLSWNIPNLKNRYDISIFHSTYNCTSLP